MNRQLTNQQNPVVNPEPTEVKVEQSVTELQQLIQDFLQTKISQAIQCDVPNTVGTSCVYEDFDIAPPSSYRTSTKDDILDSEAKQSDYETITDHTESETLLGNLSYKIEDILEDIENENNTSQVIQLVKNQLKTALGTLAFAQQYDDHNSSNSQALDSKSRHSQTTNGKLHESDFMTAQESAIQTLIQQNKMLLEKSESNARRNWKGNRGRFK